MNKQTILIYDFDTLFDILIEIRQNFKFDILKAKTKKELSDIDKNNLGNYLILTTSQNSSLFSSNCFIIEKLPIKINLLIEKLNILSQNTTVLSEIGSKSADILIPPYKWIKMMDKEIDAGSWKVIAEAREGGNVGICRETGEVRSDLIEEILTKIPQDKILWEAPQKSQQVWFIKLMGANVNLGNIAPHEIIPLECLRLGLRGDTFYDFLPKK